MNDIIEILREKGLNQQQIDKIERLINKFTGETPPKEEIEPAAAQPKSPIYHMRKEEAKPSFAQGKKDKLREKHGINSRAEERNERHKPKKVRTRSGGHISIGQGTQQMRNEPLYTGPRENELFKYVESKQRLTADTEVDSKIKRAAPVPRIRQSNLQVMECDECGDEDEVNPALYPTGRYVCNNCVTGKGKR